MHIDEKREDTHEIIAEYNFQFFPSFNYFARFFHSLTSKYIEDTRN